MSTSSAVLSREELPREVVDRIVGDKMRRNPTADRRHLSRIVWREIENDVNALRAFVADAVGVAFDRIVERERDHEPDRRPDRTVIQLRPPVDPEKQRAQARDISESLYASLETYIWPNGKPLLDVTVREVGQFSGWGQAILHLSKLKHAKPDDRIGKYLTVKDLYACRTWK